MLKRIIFISLALFGLLSVTTAKKCFADALAQLAQAKTYENDGHYEQAEAIYKTIVTDYPGTDYALKAQKRLVIVYILTKKDSETQATIDKLTADFSGNPRVPVALYHIAGKYKWPRKEYQKAKSIYQQIIQQYPGSSYASKAQLEISKMNILSLIESGKDTEAQAAFDKLTTDFSGHSDFPAALYHIAGRYEWPRKEYEKAKTIYQQVIQRYPDSSYARKAQFKLAKINIMSLIESGEDTAAQTAIDQLIADFSGNSALPAVASRLAEQYRSKANGLEKQGLAVQARGYFQKAATIWERVINELPYSAVRAEASYYAGDCYRRLGEYKKSIKHYQRTVDDYPEYQLHWHALFLVGHNAEKLKESGAISQSEADAKTKAAYKQLLEKYPDCKAAKIALRWLSRHVRAK